MTYQLKNLCTFPIRIQAGDTKQEVTIPPAYGRIAKADRINQKVARACADDPVYGKDCVVDVVELEFVLSKQSPLPPQEDGVLLIVPEDVLRASPADRTDLVSPDFDTAVRDHTGSTIAFRQCFTLG